MRLILVRHAKAEAGVVDVTRQLAPRGKSDAAAAGRLLARAGIAPDRVALSPATRARQTWDGIQAGLAERVEVVVDERIYDNVMAGLVEVIADVGAAGSVIGCLALVGHNPSIAELAAALDDGEGDPEARVRLRAGFATSGVAVFEVTGGWDDLALRSATLLSFDVARGPA